MTLPPTTAEPPETVIGPQAGWQVVDFAELWRFRTLLAALAWRDVQLRYKQTVLGATWAVIQPAATMAVFALFLGQVAKVPTGGVPYPLFAYAGLLPWLLFAGGMGNAANSVVGSEGLITKVYFPRLLLPVAAVGSAVVDFVISFALLLALLLLYGYGPSWGLLLVPGIAGLAVAAAVGVGALLAALNVSYRDFRYVIPFVVQLGMFATPSIYLDLDAAGPGPAADLAYLNPMTAVVAGFRAAALDRPVPWRPLAASAGVIAAVLVAGCWYFRRVEDGFADVI